MFKKKIPKTDPVSNKGYGCCIPFDKEPRVAFSPNLDYDTFFLPTFYTFYTPPTPLPPTFAGGKAAETMILPHLQVISS